MYGSLGPFDPTYVYRMLEEMRDTGVLEGVVLDSEELLSEEEGTVVQDMIGDHGAGGSRDGPEGGMQKMGESSRRKFYSVP